MQAPGRLSGPYGARSNMEDHMAAISIARQTGRSLAAATALVAAVALSAAPTPAEARGGIGTGAAVGIGLGAFALGTAVGSAPYYGGYYGGYGGYGGNRHLSGLGDKHAAAYSPHAGG